jgi:hypothetical protein
MYDMPLRDYDPAIGRWMVQDPVIHHSQSPYNSFDGNPAYWSDPSGGDSTEFMNFFDIYGRNKFDENGIYIAPPDRGAANPEIREILRSLGRSGGAVGSFVRGIYDLGSSGYIKRIFIGNALLPIVPDDGDSNLSTIPILALYKYEFVNSPFAQGGGMEFWNEANSKVIGPSNGIAGFFEQGAKFANRGVNTVADVASNLAVIKVASSVSILANLSQVGYAATNYYNNRTAGNFARVVAQGTIIAIEIGLNAAVPGLGVVVGIGLNILESSDYMQDIYKSLDE